MLDTKDVNNSSYQGISILPFFFPPLLLLKKPLSNSLYEKFILVNNSSLYLNFYLPLYIGSLDLYSIYLHFGSRWNAKIPVPPTP